MIDGTSDRTFIEWGADRQQSGLSAVMDQPGELVFLKASAPEPCRVPITPLIDALVKKSIQIAVLEFDRGTNAVTIRDFGSSVDDPLAVVDITLVIIGKLEYEQALKHVLTAILQHEHPSP